MSEKEKDSNELLNILMIVIGGLFVFKAVLDGMAYLGLLIPSWLAGFSAADATAALSMFGTQSIVAAALGFLPIQDQLSGRHLSQP